MQAAWDRAEALSEATGNPYKDRDGVVRNAEDKSLAARVLRQWCDMAGKRYDAGQMIVGH